ncbi:MAG: hypothetical protein HY096_15675, partial [Nitrospinae bacterium]|nr:hypothetical protein [Nitrospinota bacterium]
VIIINCLSLIPTPSHALWWMVYHKPAFKGKVIDAETKKPIEGAVVVAIYYADPIISGPGGGSAFIINIKETLTDKNGEFYISSYTTITNPNAMESDVEFIIFKPGYGSFPNYQKTPSGLKPVDQQIFFSKEIGSKGELEMWIKGENGSELKKLKVTFGIIELPKLKTREERKEKLPFIPGPGISFKKMENLVKAINEEEIYLGLAPTKEQRMK